MAKPSPPKSVWVGENESQARRPAPSLVATRGTRAHSAACPPAPSRVEPSVALRVPTKETGAKRGPSP